MPDDTQNPQTQPGVNPDPTTVVGGAPAAGATVPTQTDAPVAGMPQADPMQVNPEPSVPVSDTPAAPAMGAPVATVPGEVKPEETPAA